MNIANQHIILTGAASGIGRALLTRLAAYPVKILAVDYNTAALEAAVSSLTGQPAQIYSHVADLTLPANVDAVFETALAQMGHIDIFIANAGFAYYEKIASADWQHVENIYRLNVFSPIYAALRMRELNQGRPYRVVMTASAMAKFNLPGYALYGSTKAALDRFAEGYRLELEPNGKLTLVYPIATRTNFFDAANDGTPVPWPSQTPETVAQAIVRGLERDLDTVFPSALFRWTWIISHVIPGLNRAYQLWEQRAFQRWLRTRKT